jgi:hypothetical protein
MRIVNKIITVLTILKNKEMIRDSMSIWSISLHEYIFLLVWLMKKGMSDRGRSIKTRGYTKFIKMKYL